MQVTTLKLCLLVCIIKNKKNKNKKKEEEEEEKVVRKCSSSSLHHILWEDFASIDEYTEKIKEPITKIFDISKIKLHLFQNPTSKSYLFLGLDLKFSE